ncbi:MAG: TRAP transporter small permease [Pseudomonadota bacterium]|nr:TRAP transporter small permease [Pseudomonadota bacterium]
MSIFRFLDSLLRKLSYLGFLVASALLLVVGVMGTADVISTNLFFKPVPGLLELSGALLAVIVFLGLAEAQARGSNIIIDVATQQMGPTMKRLSSLLTLAIGMAFMGLVAWQASKLALSSWSYNEKALGAFAFPVAPFKSVACFGAWLATAEFARQFLRQLVAAEPDAGGQEESDPHA